MNKTQLYVLRSEELLEMLHDVETQAPTLLAQFGDAHLKGYISGIKTAIKLVGYLEFLANEYSFDSQSADA